MESVTLLHPFQSHHATLVAPSPTPLSVAARRQPARRACTFSQQASAMTTNKPELKSVAMPVRMDMSHPGETIERIMDGVY
jgi:hypothetical protein